MAFFEESLSKAVLKGDCKEIAKFFKKGLSPDFVFKSENRKELLGKTILQIAVANKKHDLVKLLVRQGCDPDLSYVVGVKDYKTVTRKYENKRKLKQTCLYHAIVKGDELMADLLVSAGTDVNMTDDRGCTPIWHAVDLDNYSIAKSLLSSKRWSCDVNIHDVTHLYPIHVAAIYSSLRMTSLLIKHGALVDVVTVRGSTPLILACKAGSYDVAKLLLLNGADPNHRGINGHTPISAVLEGCPDTTQLFYSLLEAGARAELADVRKCFKEKLPILYRFPEVKAILKELALTPTSLKMASCLAVRKYLLASKSDEHLMNKILKLPVPSIIKDFLLLEKLNRLEKENPPPTWKDITANTYDMACSMFRMRRRAEQTNCETPFHRQ